MLPRTLGMNSALRSELDKLVRLEGPVPAYRDALAKLRPMYPHSIDLLLAADDDLERRENCYIYAFAICPRIVCAVTGLAPNILVDDSFVHALLPTLRLRHASARDGDLLVYFDDEIPIHAGVVHKGRVISKWGRGHIYEHARWEVPTAYGRSTIAYCALTPGLATQGYLDYAKQHLDYRGVEELFERDVTVARNRCRQEGLCDRH